MKKSLIKIMACVMMVGSLVACGEKKEESTVKNDVKVETLTGEVANALGDNYWPTQKITENDATELYGITADNIEEIIAEVPMMATHKDILLIAKAKEGKVEDVKAEVEALRQSEIDDTMQYPMNIPKIAASSVEVIGNYVVYVQLGGEAVELTTDDEIKAACEADNKTAIDTIKAQLNA